MKKYLIILFMLILPVYSFADNSIFQEGKEYTKLKTPVSIQQAPGQVQVIEFFNYGCPPCFRMESNLDAWMKLKPNFVNFVRIPAVFHPEWEMISKAYYAAQKLKVTEKIEHPILDAIHVQHQVFSTQESLEPIFLATGISKSDLQNALSSSDVQSQMKAANDALDSYQVTIIPSFVINGKYQTSPRLVGNDFNKLFEVINFLIAKERGGIK